VRSKLTRKRCELSTMVATVATACASLASVKALNCSVTNTARGGVSDDRGPASRLKSVTSLFRRRRVAFAPFLALALLVLALPPASAVGRGKIARAVKASGAPADLWPEFGHDPLHSGLSPDTAISASTASGLGKRWTASLSADSFRAPSPVVAYSGRLNETVVYTVTFGGTVSAFDAATGKLVWSRSVGANVEAAPAVYNGTVYIGDLNGRLHALNKATGAVHCTFTLPVIPPATKPGEIVSSPVVGDVDGKGPTVFFGDAGLHPKGQPEDLINGGHFWAITGVGNTAGGCREKWVYYNWPKKGSNGTQTGVWDEPALAQNSQGGWEVVFGTGNPDQSVYALNAVNGSRLWRYHTQQNGPDEDVGAGPTIGAPGANGFADGVVYVDGKDGIEYAFDLLTGKKIWQFTLGPGTNQAHGVSEAALSGNTLVACYANSIFALNATTGAVIWHVTRGNLIQASPAVSGPSGDQAVFVGDTTGTEYGFNLQSGAQVFAVPTTGSLEASAAVADGMLYFTNGGTFYAYGPS
jgi:outer membrane protein assembly factor BamB